MLIIISILTGFVKEQSLADLVQNDITWSRTYINYREYGGSLFGESSIIELTDVQRELISVSQLYDVLKSQSETAEKVPKALWPYPTKLSKWYAAYTQEQRKVHDGKGKQTTKFATDTTEDTVQNMAAWHNRKQEAAKSPDWARKYMKK